MVVTITVHVSKNRAMRLKAYEQGSKLLMLLSGDGASLAFDANSLGVLASCKTEPRGGSSLKRGLPYHA